MMIFKGCRNLDEIKESMIKKKMDVDTDGFDRGSDYIFFTGEWFGKGIKIGFNTFNGCFFVTENDKIIANERSELLDSEKWYVELLNTFYEPATD